MPCAGDTSLVTAHGSIKPVQSGIMPRVEQEGCAMGTDDHGPSIKDDEQYEALRDEGMSKEAAARIATTDRSEAGERGGSSPPYEEWTVDELRERAQELDVDGRAEMDKDELIEALRNR
jgi:hypothetical protein